MVEITRSLVGPGSKLYSAVIQQAETVAEVVDVINKANLSLAAINEALKVAQKDKYLASLDSTVDSRIAKLKESLLDAGYDDEQANIIAEANRSKMDKGLPKGLTLKTDKDGNPLISMRGKSKDESPTAPAVA